MFTGIITNLGTIKNISKSKKFILTVAVAKSFVKKIKLGNSVAVDGVCLTTAKIFGNNLIFELMPETARLTIAENYRVGSLVNLEMALRLGDELGGHLVSGHVDGVGLVTAIQPEKNSLIITIKPPTDLLKYLAHKGSVTINGVSLTIIRPPRFSKTFQVSLVSYTLEHTNLSKLKVGSSINLEIDLLARYLEKLQSKLN